jgi:hypothetical protein
MRWKFSEEELPILATVIGKACIQSGKYGQVMVFVYLLKFCSESPMSHALLERQELSLIWEILRLILARIYHECKMVSFRLWCLHASAGVFGSNGGILYHQLCTLEL